VKGFVLSLFRPHSHDAADSVDSALEASTEGIRAVKISLVALGLTAVAQLIVVLITGSVALLADTIHNFSDALTAIPLWVAFVLSRRPANRRLLITIPPLLMYIFASRQIVAGMTTGAVKG
jgi:Co/Zn/Cd efflux system component